MTGFPENVLAVACEGRVTRNDYAALQRHPKLRVYYEVTPQFAGIDAGAVWEDFPGRDGAPVVLGADGRRHRRGLDPIGDERIRFLLPGKLRVFPVGEIDETRRWISAENA